jgi:nucleotidyltransferase/DNA polymerase involved in DNA repair
MEDRLENVSGIGKATAERMKAAGIDTVQKLASMKPEDLLKLKIKGIGKATAEKYINSAKKVIDSDQKKEVKEKTKKKEPKKAEAIKKEEKPVKRKPSKEATKLKDLIKKQAECNIGLVGHVDHGMIMSLRHFP